MLDRRFIRDNPEDVKAAVRVKGIDLDVDELLRLDQSSRELQRDLDEAQTQRKSFAREFGRADEATREKLKAEHEEQDLHLRSVREQLTDVGAHPCSQVTVELSGAPTGEEQEPSASAPAPAGAQRERNVRKALGVGDRHFETGSSPMLAERQSKRR